MMGLTSETLPKGSHFSSEGILSRWNCARKGRVEKMWECWKAKLGRWDWLESIMRRSNKGEFLMSTCEKFEEQNGDHWVAVSRKQVIWRWQICHFSKKDKKNKKKNKNKKQKKKAKKNPNSNTFQKNLLVPVGFTIDQVSRFILRILTRKVTEVKLIWMY